MELTEKQLNQFRGKFRRLCEPKRDSGRLEVPEDIHNKYVAKGAAREKLFESFVLVGGDKDCMGLTCIRMRKGLLGGGCPGSACYLEIHFRSRSCAG